MPQPLSTGNVLGLSTADRSRRAAGRKAKKRTAGAVADAVRSVIEPLEDRVLLSSYFVSTGGSDSNAGTLASPFRTIQRAGQAANWGDTVFIRGGTYRETVTPAHSGVTFTNYNNEAVTVSGADVVSSFSYAGSSQYVANVGWDLGGGNNQVFVDGQAINEARWPNTGLDLSHPTLAQADGGGGGTLYDSALTQGNGFWTGSAIHLTAGQEWVWQTGTVTGSGPGWISFNYNNISSYLTPGAGTQYYLSGNGAALDAAGEWYMYPGGNQVYLRTANDSNPNGHVVEVKHRQYAFDLTGVSNTLIQGLNLFAATVATSGASSSTAIDHVRAAYPDAFTYLPNGWGSQPDGAGIVLKGSNSLVANSVIGWSSGYGVLLTGSGSRVTNTIIHDVAQSGGEFAGIQLNGSGEEADHNSVYNSGRYGIRVQSTGAKIVYNDIHDWGLQTTDVGGIYTIRQDGGGGEIAYNNVYNAHTGGYGASGIMLDDNSSGWNIHNNAIWNVNNGMKLNFSSYNEGIYNNSVQGDDNAIFGNYKGSWGGSNVYNNVFYGSARLGDGASSWNNGYGSAGGGQGPGSFSAGANISDLPPQTPSDGGGSSSSGSSAPPPVQQSSGGWNATTALAAVNYSDASSGVQRVTGAVGYLDGGSWVKYSNVNFGSGVSYFQAALATDWGYGGQIEIRVGSPTGRLAGVLDSSPTGGWVNYQVRSTAVSGLTGTQDIYLVARGGYAVADLAWIVFG